VTRYLKYAAAKLTQMTARDSLLQDFWWENEVSCSKILQYQMVMNTPGCMKTENDLPNMEKSQKQLCCAACIWEIAEMCDWKMCPERQRCDGPLKKTISQTRARSNILAISQSRRPNSKPKSLGVKHVARIKRVVLRAFAWWEGVCQIKGAMQRIL
jgi:hypothetical protein